MLHARDYFHIGINSLDCREYSWGVRQSRRDFVFTHEALLEMHVWTVTQQAVDRNVRLLGLSVNRNVEKRHTFSVINILIHVRFER